MYELEFRHVFELCALESRLVSTDSLMASLLQYFCGRANAYGQIPTTARIKETKIEEVQEQMQIYV